MTETLDIGSLNAWTRIGRRRAPQTRNPPSSEGVQAVTSFSELRVILRMTPNQPELRYDFLGEFTVRD